MKIFDRILLVDDNEIFSFMTTEIIEESDLFDDNLASVSNGLEALEYLEGLHKEIENPDVLIFLDINMPVMDGWGFLEAFSESKMRVTTAVYVLSSSINKEDEMKALSYPIVKEYISKPLSEEFLKEIAQEYFE